MCDYLRQYTHKVALTSYHVDELMIVRLQLLLRRVIIVTFFISIVNLTLTSLKSKI